MGVENSIEAIERWFAAQGTESEFHQYDRAVPYSLARASSADGPILYCTKPQLIAALMQNAEGKEGPGLIGRYGLPHRADSEWLRRVVDKHTLWFLGDLDPVDLMVFAWLRHQLNSQQMTLSFCGVGDTLLRSLKVNSFELVAFPCGATEVSAIPTLFEVFGDLSWIVGPDCAGLLQRGYKIEVDSLAYRGGFLNCICRDMGHSGSG